MGLRNGWRNSTPDRQTNQAGSGQFNDGEAEDQNAENAVVLIRVNT
jgi:hypothetical protein